MSQLNVNNITKYTGGEVVVNDASEDVDFRIESDGNTHAFFVEASTSHIGINNASPSVALDVTGDANISGDFDVTGNVVMGTSGKGIDFSATSGTGTSELLDDYEEGDWTVQDTDGGGSNQSGAYTKIGNLVTCQFSLTTGAISGSNTFYLTNLPFTVGATDAFRGPVTIAYTNATTMILAGNVVESSTTAYLLIATGDIATDDEIGASKVIAAAITYRV